MCYPLKKGKVYTNSQFTEIKECLKKRRGKGK